MEMFQSDSQDFSDEWAVPTEDVRYQILFPARTRENTTVWELSKIQVGWLFLYWYVYISADLLNTFP